MVILRTTLITLSVIITLITIITFSSLSYSDASIDNKKQVTLIAILEDQGDPDRWNSLLHRSIRELNAKHPDLDIQLNYTTYPYGETREQLLRSMSDKTSSILLPWTKFGLENLRRRDC
jgi:multiple sugar transport system substrate-binding protein